MKNHPYRKFALMLIISFVIMYAAMFLNVDRAEHIYFSQTRLYMALLMVSPMALLMLGFMGPMYPSRRANAGIAAGSIAVFVLALVLLRTQALVTDVQYMKAMIPHHSSAILTSKNANITDPEVKELSRQIIEAQEREITQMKKVLARMAE